MRSLVRREGKGIRPAEGWGILPHRKRPFLLYLQSRDAYMSILKFLLIILRNTTIKNNNLSLFLFSISCTPGGPGAANLMSPRPPNRE